MADPTVEDRIASYLEAEEVPEEAPQDEEPEADIPVDESTEPETEDNEPAAEDAPDDEVDEIQITSLQELAEHEDIDIADLYGLNVSVNGPDGKPQAVPLGELKDSYHASKLAQADRSKLQEQTQQFEKIAAQKHEEFEQKVFIASKMIETVEKQVLGEVNSPQIQELRHTDPAEYAAIMAEHQGRVEQVNQMKSNLQNEWEQSRAKSTEEMQAKKAEFIQRAVAVLPKVIPEWQDENVAKKESKEVGDYFLANGYTAKEVEDLMDPRAIVAFRKAMMFDKLQQNQPDRKKKVVSIGKKVLKSGKSKSKQERGNEKKSKAFQDFRKSGGDDLRQAARLIEENFLGDL